jgi:hypothetical protein
MPLDDVFLALQHVVDRLVRRIRLGPAPARGRRRLVVVQIDGLSRGVLERALTQGRMPFVRRLIERTHRLEPMSVGMPTSTPAFQMAAMYGVRPDIPGFHYHDKRRRRDIHFPRAGHAAHVEERHTTGRRGILQDGSAYGCVFTGGAVNNFFSFATLTRPTGHGVLRVLSAFVILFWTLVKGTVLTTYELMRALLRLIADPVTEARRGVKRVFIKIGVSVWVREFFTLAASRDIYRGVPAIYVNYLDYDVFAHAYGPEHPLAVRSLRRVDESIRDLARAVRRVPEYGYDLYVLSDHGQAHCVPVHRLHDGRGLEDVLFDEVFTPVRPAGQPAGRPFRPHFMADVRAFRARHSPGLLQRFVNYLDRDFARGDREEHEARQRDDVRIIAAGPNAFIYFLDATAPLDLDAITARYPDLIDDLSRRRDIGFVLVRSAAGPVCGWAGKRVLLGESDAGPFAGRPDLRLVLDGIKDLMAMESAGDLVIYGNGAAAGNVSYVAEIGAHAGPSPEELHAFIVHPVRANLPAPITHPLQLYPCFMGYQDTDGTPA